MEPSPKGAEAAAVPARGITQVLIATLLYAGVAPVAKLVALDAAAITFWRAAFGAASLLLFLIAGGGSLRVMRADIKSLLSMGALMAGNWYFFVLAAQVSTVAIAVVCLFTYPLLTAVIEPWFFREQRRRSEIAGGALVVVGCALLVETSSLGDASARGALLGILSALCLSFRNLLNRRAIRRYASSTLTFYQFLVAGLLFAPVLSSSSGWPASRDVPALLFIGAILTTFSHVLFTAALRHVSASRASLVLSLQPIVAILIAVPLLGEVPRLRTALGGALILVAAALPLLGPRRATA